MKSIFAIFGSKTSYYLEIISDFYNSENKAINSTSYKSKGALYLDVALANVEHLDNVKELSPRSDRHFNIGSLQANYVVIEDRNDGCAPNSCVSALKDLDSENLIGQKYSHIISNLNGNFNIIWWDQASSTLRFSSSAFNPRSLFYAWLDGCFIVSSDLRLIQQLVPPKIDKIAILQWLAGRPDPNRSMFNNIDQLPFAHTASVTLDKKLSLERFWDINPDRKLVLPNDKEYQQHFYDLLSRSVQDSLGADISNKPIFSQMSGGMDSTSITAILNSMVSHGQNDSKPARFNLHSISHTYRNTQSCDEIDKIEEMREFLKLQHSHFVELDKFSSLSFAELYPTQLQSPGMVASPKYQQEAQMIHKLGGQHLFTGNGGDEMCWGHSLAYRDRLANGELGVINEVLNSAKQLGMSPFSIMLQVLVKPMLPARLLTLLGKQPVDTEHFPAWLGARQQDMLKSIAKHNPFANSKELAKRARYEGLFHTSTFNSMRSYQHVCDPLGIAVHHPFFNKQIAEFSFAVPQKLHIQGPYPKHLLRSTMDHHLPKSVCWDQNKTVFDQHFANLVRANKKELRELLAHPGLQDLGLVDNDILLASFDKVVSSPNSSLNVDLLYAILTQSWYQTHML